MGDDLGLLHSRAERYIRSLEVAPDRWHFDGETIYLINGSEIKTVPFGEDGAGEVVSFASEGSEEDMRIEELNIFLNPNDLGRMPLEEMGIGSNYRMAISLVPEYIISEDQGLPISEVVAFLSYLSDLGFDSSSVQVLMDTEFNEIDIVSMGEFDYHQMIQLHDALSEAMDEAPSVGYVYAIFTNPGIAMDFYPMNYGYPAGRQAMLGRSFASEDTRSFESAVRIPATDSIVERVMSTQAALQASEMQQRLMRVQYLAKQGLIQDPEDIMRILSGDSDHPLAAEGDDEEIRVGDLIRSYDFPFGSDVTNYIQGIVTAIAPAPDDVCPCSFDHYHVRTTQRVINGESQPSYSEFFYPVADPTQTRISVRIRGKGLEAESTDACPLCQSPPEEWEDSFVCEECDRTICSGCDTSDDEDPICPECEAMEDWDLPLPDSLKAPRFDEGIWFLDEPYNVFDWSVVENYDEYGFGNHDNREKPMPNLDWRDLMDGERGDDEQIDLRAIIPVEWPMDLNGSETFTSITDPDRKINLNGDGAPVGDYIPTPILVRIRKGSRLEESYLDRGYLPLGSDDQPPVVKWLDQHRTPGDTEECLYISVDDEIFRCRATLDEDGYIIYEAPRGRPKCGRCGKSGHNARTCDQPAPPKTLKPRSRSDDMVKCSNCDERGHTKTTCPHPERVEVIDPNIIPDFEKWKSGESKMQLAGRVKRNIRRLLEHESGIGAHQLVSRYHDNLGSTSRTRTEVNRVTRIANNMPDVILWRDGYYLLGSGGKEEFFRTGPGSLRT